MIFNNLDCFPYASTKFFNLLVEALLPKSAVDIFGTGLGETSKFDNKSPVIVSQPRSEKSTTKPNLQTVTHAFNILEISGPFSFAFSRSSDTCFSLIWQFLRISKGTPENLLESESDSDPESDIDIDFESCSVF